MAKINDAEYVDALRTLFLLKGGVGFDMVESVIPTVSLGDISASPYGPRRRWSITNAVSPAAGKLGYSAIEMGAWSLVQPPAFVVIDHIRVTASVNQSCLLFGYHDRNLAHANAGASAVDNDSKFWPTVTGPEGLVMQYQDNNNDQPGLLGGALQPAMERINLLANTTERFLGGPWVLRTFPGLTFGRGYLVRTVTVATSYQVSWGGWVLPSIR